jgi:predicted enzyme related to lactoylglutathione lyase
MGNPFVHVELMANDVEKAKTFYGKLFEWQLEDMPMPTGAYTMIRVGNGTGGGIMHNPIPNSPSAWMVYVEVSDLNASTEKAIALGAKVMKERTEIPGMGAFTIIGDPAGSMIGLWQTKK